MFGLGIPELLIMLVAVLVLFGAGKLPNVMGDLGKGLSEFKKGMAGLKDDEKAIEAPKAEAKVTAVKATPKKAPAKKAVKATSKTAQKAASKTVSKRTAKTAKKTG